MIHARRGGRNFLLLLYVGKKKIYSLHKGKIGNKPEKCGLMGEKPK